MTAAAPEVVVVGSLNQDLTVAVPRLPRAGETVLGDGLRTGAGGKGANQAVAVARLGLRVAMVGRVGDDGGGRALMAGLADDGVDVGGVRLDDLAPTGTAMIVVDSAGENMIVVSPGANGRVGIDDVGAVASVLGGAAVTLLQLEVPLEAVAAAAAASGGTVILNPAPAAPLPAELLARVDVLVPNRTELALLAGTDPPDGLDDVTELASGLDGPAAVVVTLGAEGALVWAAGAATHVPAPVVEAVDATAAGDAFCGGLTDGLVRGDSLVEAVRWAVRVGAVAATRHGAQPSLPTRSDVERLLP